MENSNTQIKLNNETSFFYINFEEINRKYTENMFKDFSENDA